MLTVLIIRMIFINANGVIELNKKIFESIKVIIDCAWLGPKIINNNHINTTQALDADEKKRMGTLPCYILVQILFRINI